MIIQDIVIILVSVILLLRLWFTIRNACIIFNTVMRYNSNLSRTNHDATAGRPVAITPWCMQRVFSPFTADWRLLRMLWN